MPTTSSEATYTATPAPRIFAGARVKTAADGGPARLPCASGQVRYVQQRHA